MDVNSISVICAAAALGFAAFGGALGMSKAIIAALESMARQPEVRGPITTTMIIGLALIESLVIYCLVIALILLFVQPFKGV